MVGILITLLFLWLLWKLGIFTLKVLGFLFVILVIGFLFHILLIPALGLALLIMIIAGFQS